jgi:hypothetical protein
MTMNARIKRADALAQKVAQAAADNLPDVGIVHTFEAPWDEQTRADDAEGRRLLAEADAGRLRVRAHVHIVNAPGPGSRLIP